MKMKNYKYIARIILLILLPFNLLSQTKEEVFNSLIKKFSNLQTIKIEFQSINDKNYKGILTADNNDRYRFDLPNKNIICDGISVWNYTPSEKQVIISRFKPNSSSAIQSVFFNITKSFTPINLISENSGKSVTWRLLLKSKDKSEDEITLILDNKYNIKNVIYKYDNLSGNLLIKKIILNKKLPKNFFTYFSKKGIEEIDLR